MLFFSLVPYLTRRLLYAVPTVFGVALVVFALFHLVGGDPAYVMLGKHAGAQQIAELRHELGLDQPLYLQFVDYLRQIVTFDFGLSYATREPIHEMIWNGVGPSLSLAIPAFLMTVIFSVLIAAIAAYFRGGWLDRFVVMSCVAGMSISALAFILFGQYFLAFKWDLFPIAGYEFGWSERFAYVLMPALIWVAVSLGSDVRFYRTAILEESTQDYVRTARAKGLSEPRLMLKHVLRNSLVAVVTYLMIEIPFLVTGSFLLESFFGIPGLGSLTIDAVHNSDFPVIKAMTTFQSLLFIAGTLITDVLYAVVDPRIRLNS